jgi:hypothetical protein
VHLSTQRPATRRDHATWFTNAFISRAGVAGIDTPIHRRPHSDTTTTVPTERERSWTHRLWYLIAHPNRSTRSSCELVRACLGLPSEAWRVYEQVCISIRKGFTMSVMPRHTTTHTPSQQRPKTARKDIPPKLLLAKDITVNLSKLRTGSSVPGNPRRRKHPRPLTWSTHAHHRTQ